MRNGRLVGRLRSSQTGFATAMQAGGLREDAQTGIAPRPGAASTPCTNLT
jgi:hypothetical protein